MALSLDEALGMSLADEADENIHVDVNTRQITIPESQKLFGVESDADVEVKHIVIDGRYADGNRDLSELAWRVIYRNANKDTSYYLIPSVVANENSIEMDWLIKRSVVAYKGTVDFILCAFATTSSGEVTPEWNSTLGQGIVLEGLETSAIDINKEVVDELAKILYETIKSRDAAASSATDATKSQRAAAASERKAEASKNLAKTSETAAKASAKEARSWAVGDTASRPGEGMDNAKYYATLAQQITQGAVGFYATYAALNAAQPTGKDGNWAIVGTTDTIWVWDSDTGTWKDTGESSKFANYYDKTQIDEKLPKPVTVTVPSSAWMADNYTVAWDDGSTSSYTTCATVTVAGVTEDSRIVVSDRTRVTDAVRMVAALEPGTGVVKFYANSAPTSAAVFVLEVSQ